MNWEKLGVVIEPQPATWWMSEYAGPSFVRVTGNDSIDVYVTGRDNRNVSRIGLVHATLTGTSFTINEIGAEPLFDVGEVGCFDENGVSYPWLVDRGQEWFLYYVGWVAGGRARFQNFTGLAVGPGPLGPFKRISRVPILDRIDEEPFGSGSCAVVPHGDAFRMVYTSFDSWQVGADATRPVYRLKEATSEDGINWHRNGRIVVDFKSTAEHVIGKPMLLVDGDLTHLWYSHRGDAYRIGYAYSVDGTTFTRNDENVGIGTSSEGWDSEMVEYAYVFDLNEFRYMIYNGNQFGKTGLGLAILRP